MLPRGVRVLSWNLYHGRSRPPSGRSLLREFAGALAGWEWDVALLQEVPPWWPPRLAAATGAAERTQLTSRNCLLPLRRAISVRNPDILKSNGGGSNAILVRGQAIEEHRSLRLRFLPERRWVHAVRLPDGSWVANVHSQSRPQPAAQSDSERALAVARDWAAGAPLVFGGDLNLRQPAFPGMVHVAGHHVDHIFTDGRAATGPGEVIDRGPLSDHAPLAVTLA
jgi:endonuclease/exonuclease/phosphatase family metal-dependent hydrolase